MGLCGNLAPLGPSRTRGQFWICSGQIWLEIGQWQKNCPESYSCTWEQNMWTKHHTMLWASCNFLRNRLYSLFPSTNHDTRDLKMFPRRILAVIWIHVVAKWERYQFYREVYRIETLLHITCQIISESRHPRYCFPRFVSVWPTPEVVDGIFEVCPSATKFCPSVKKLVALGFSLQWQIFDISKQFCPLVRLGPELLVFTFFGLWQLMTISICASILLSQTDNNATFALSIILINM